MSADTNELKLNRQAEAVFYSFRFVFFWNEYPWDLSGVFGASTGLLWVTARVLNVVFFGRLKLKRRAYPIVNACRASLKRSEGPVAKRRGLGPEPCALSGLSYAPQVTIRLKPTIFTISGFYRRWYFGT
jgi:hypothetical protein